MSKPSTFEKLSDILIEQLGVEPAELPATLASWKTSAPTVSTSPRSP